MQEMNVLTNRSEWNQLTAVRNGAVYVADYDLFTQPSAGTLTDGIEILAAMFNPSVFDVPARLAHKCVSLSGQTVMG